ncbi:SMC5-SMC6 complex localization factor protein 2 [Heteronotia binoei]|uniref:SMC5-SMC6 complex localization factor protein 2 n=1 Tax=Heteronotia binoei TaxID=13085 RepID=UPI00292DD298|nr:SMC5-SMC6 complex localization factor protein 2 [Heteronotia binoei]
MTQYLNSSQSNGGDSRPLWGSLGSPARLYCKLAGRADGARNGRNQCITDFFLPAPKQDRAVLCSPEKRNGKVGLPVSHAGHPRRNVSSPKQNRRKKFPPPPPDRSPIIDAFFKVAKIEKKDSSNNDGASIALETSYAKVASRKLFTSEGSSDCSFKNDTCMRDLEKSEKCPVQTRTPLVENSRECEMEYMDLDTVSPVFNKQVSASENDSLRKESHISWCQKTSCSKMLQSSPANALHQSSTEVLGSNKQDTMDFLRKRSCSASWESSTDCDHDTILPSSSDLNELNDEDSNLEIYMSNKKLRSLSDSEDGNPDCSLDSSDDEILLPFEEILARSAKSPKNPEPISDEDDTQDIVIPSHNSLLSKPSIETQVSYVNRLEHLLKEKEEFRRVDELEKQLQEVKWEVERDLSKELPNDGELSAEHRAFIERYSVIDAIPDQHPGENIFQIAQAGKIFSQHNLDLRNSGFFPHNPIEKYLLGSGITQQLFVINEGLLMSAYHSSPCPVPILKWMFRMMSVHSDRFVSKKILDMLMALTIKNASISDQPRLWIPSLFDIATVLINMGVPFNTLFPLLHFQPTFTEDNIKSEMYRTMGNQTTGDFSENLPFFFLVQSCLCNMAKFLQLCVGICPEHYTDKEILLLLLLLFKLSLEKELKQYPLVDLEYLIIKLLENIRRWDTEMPKLCLAISDLSSHHHDLLWLVQFIPNWTSRGRQARRHLSLVVISKLLKNHVNIPSSEDQQMALLCQDLVEMKPSNCLKKITETEMHQDGLSKESLLSEFEPQAYYLTYVLLHLVREASNSEAAYSNQRKWLLKLCSTLEKHVKCDIREDARLFYRTKVKDLVARTYSKWQQMIHSSRPTQGTIHDFWDPDS